MTSIPKIEAPGHFVPQIALSFGESGAPALPIHEASPLPVRTINLPAASTPLAGSADADVVAGPFVPEPARAIWISLSGSWTGTVTVTRSIDGGLTRLPLTMGGDPWARFTGNANEPIGEESAAEASWYLDIEVSSGAVTYEVRQ